MVFGTTLAGYTLLRRLFLLCQIIYAVDQHGSTSTYTFNSNVLVYEYALTGAGS